GSLTVTAVSSTQVDLSWPDVSGETLYRLERKTGAGAFGPLTTKTANTTTHSDTTVTAGTNYTYQIRAENTYGYSAWTASNSVTTPGGGETTFVTGQNLSPSQWNNYTGW
ncbi:MAG TPA: fibronectin type III domain-containing protein, partial [Acidobacteriota bacterium]|nr:fibronectin type III domain-containing protein [Acidobacteriota bacterium]